jgi:S1-C subfamily serine protease
LLAELALTAALFDDWRPTARELLSTVTVTARCVTNCPRGRLSIGVGEIIDRGPDGTLVVLTARHVVVGGATPYVYVRNGAHPGVAFQAFARERYARRATVLVYAKNVDLALVSFRPLHDDVYGFAELAADRARSTARSGFVVGDPNGTLWVISHYRTLKAGSPGTFLLNCTTCGPGDSGGGVFDSNGGLLGILVQQRVYGDGAPGDRTTVFQAVSADELQLFLNATVAERGGGTTNDPDPFARFDTTLGGER